MALAGPLTDNKIRHLYRFGEFTMDPGARRLSRGGDIVPLTPKAFETLLALVENHGRVVDKQQLFERVWPGVTVEENSLTQAVSAIRRALGDKSDDPRFILTVPGQGYRFLGEILDETETATPSPEPVTKHSRFRWRLAAAALATVLIAGGATGYFFYQRSVNAAVRSLAILPFRSLDANSADNFLGLGLADVLITKLSNVPALTVRPTSAVMSYAGGVPDPAKAGRDLLVDAVVEGWVQHDGDRVRVTAHLLRSRDGAALWAGKFDDKFTSVFTVEDRVSEQVAAALMRSVDSNRRARMEKHYTENTEAHEAYIEGRFWWNRRNRPALRKSIECYERALSLDKEYALAYAGMADSWASLGALGEPPLEVFPKARRAALNALQLDEQLPEAHAALGYVEHRFDWDWVGAKAEFERAIQLNPGYAPAHQWLGWYHLSLRQFDAAIAEFSKARELDPLSSYVNSNLGTAFYFASRLDESIAQLKKVVERDQGFVVAHRWLGRAYEQKHMYAEAERELRKMVSLANGDPAYATQLGYLYAISGRTQEAREMLKRIEVRVDGKQWVDVAGLTCLYVALGENAKALDWLERLAKEHSEILMDINIDPRLDPLRKEPRFQRLVALVHFES